MMKKTTKYESKRRRHKSSSKKEARNRDKDIHLNVVGVPVANVSVKKTLPREKNENYNLYKISIDTKKRGNEEKLHIQSSITSLSHENYKRHRRKHYGTKSSSSENENMIPSPSRPKYLIETNNKKLYSSKAKKNIKTGPDICLLTPGEKNRKVRIVHNSAQSYVEPSLNKESPDPEERLPHKKVGFSDVDEVFGSTPHQSSLESDDNLLYNRHSLQIYQISNVKASKSVFKDPVKINLDNFGNLSAINENYTSKVSPSQLKSRPEIREENRVLRSEKPNVHSIGINVYRQQGDQSSKLAYEFESDNDDIDLDFRPTKAKAVKDMDLITIDKPASSNIRSETSKDKRDLDCSHVPSGSVKNPLRIRPQLIYNDVNNITEKTCSNQKFTMPDTSSIQEEIPLIAQFTPNNISKRDFGTSPIMQYKLEPSRLEESEGLIKQHPSFKPHKTEELRHPNQQFSQEEMLNTSKGYFQTNQYSVPKFSKIQEVQSPNKQCRQSFETQESKFCQIYPSSQDLPQEPYNVRDFPTIMKNNSTPSTLCLNAEKYTNTQSTNLQEGVLTQYLSPKTSTIKKISGTTEENAIVDPVVTQNALTPMSDNKPNRIAIEIPHTFKLSTGTSTIAQPHIPNNIPKSISHVQASPNILHKKESQSNPELEDSEGQVYKQHIIDQILVKSNINEPCLSTNAEKSNRSNALPKIAERSHLSNLSVTEKQPEDIEPTAHRSVNYNKKPLMVEKEIMTEKIKPNKGNISKITSKHKYSSINKIPSKDSKKIKSVVTEKTSSKARKPSIISTIPKPSFRGIRLPTSPEGLNANTKTLPTLPLFLPQNLEKIKSVEEKQSNEVKYNENKFQQMSKNLQPDNETIRKPCKEDLALLNQTCLSEKINFVDSNVDKIHSELSGSDAKNQSELYGAGINKKGSYIGRSKRDMETNKTLEPNNKSGQVIDQSIIQSNTEKYLPIGTSDAPSIEISYRSYEDLPAENISKIQTFVHSNIPSTSINHISDIPVNETMIPTTVKGVTKDKPTSYYKKLGDFLDSIEPKEKSEIDEDNYNKIIAEQNKTSGKLFHIDNCKQRDVISGRSIPFIEPILEEDNATKIEQSPSYDTNLPENYLLKNSKIGEIDNAANFQSEKEIQNNINMVAKNNLHDSNYKYDITHKNMDNRDILAYTGQVENKKPFFYKGNLRKTSHKAMDDVPQYQGNVKDYNNYQPVLYDNDQQVDQSISDGKECFHKSANESSMISHQSNVDKNQELPRIRMYDSKIKKRKFPPKSSRKVEEDNINQKFNFEKELETFNNNKRELGNEGSDEKIGFFEESGQEKLVYVGRIPNTTYNVFFSPIHENKKSSGKMQEDGYDDGQQEDNISVIKSEKQIINENPKGIIIFVNKKTNINENSFYNKKSNDHDLISDKDVYNDKLIFDKEVYNDELTSDKGLYVDELLSDEGSYDDKLTHVKKGYNNNKLVSDKKAYDDGPITTSSIEKEERKSKPSHSNSVKRRGFPVMEFTKKLKSSIQKVKGRSEDEPLWNNKTQISDGINGRSAKKVFSTKLLSGTKVVQKYPCDCFRFITSDPEHELTREEIVSAFCREGSQCKVRHPELQKTKRLISIDLERKHPLSIKKSMEDLIFPEIEVITDGIISRKPIKSTQPAPKMKGANYTGTLTLKSDKFNGVCNFYIHPRLKEFLIDNMDQFKQYLVDRDELKHYKE